MFPNKADSKRIAELLRRQAELFRFPRISKKRKFMFKCKDCKFIFACPSQVKQTMTYVEYECPKCGSNNFSPIQFEGT